MRLQNLVYLFNLIILPFSSPLPSSWMLEQRYDCPPGSLYSGAPCSVSLAQPSPGTSTVLITGMTQVSPISSSIDFTRTDCNSPSSSISKNGKIFVVPCLAKSGGLFVYLDDIGGWSLKISLRVLWDGANPLDWPIFALSGDGSFLAMTDGYSTKIEFNELDLLTGSTMNPTEYIIPIGKKVLSLVMSNDGDFLACSFDDYSEILLLQVDNSGQVTLIGSLTNPSSNNHFGETLALNQAGTELIVGAPFAGSVYVYTNGGNVLGGINAWKATGPSVLNIGGSYGSSISLSIDGLTLAIGNTHSTPATEKFYIYSRESTSSTFEAPITSTINFATISDSSNAVITSDKTPQVYLINGKKLAVAVGPTINSPDGSVYVFNAVMPSATPSQTSSPTQTPSITPSSSPTTSFSATSTISETPTVTPSISETPTITPSVTAVSASNSPSKTPSPSFIPSASSTQSLGGSASSTSAPSPSALIFTVSPPSSPTVSETSSVSYSISPTISQSITPTVSETSSPTISSSYTSTVSITPTVSETSSVSVTPTVSFTSSASITPTVSITASISDSPTSSTTMSSSETSTPTPSFTPSITPTGSISQSPSASPSISDSPSGSPSASASTSIGAIRGKGGLESDKTNNNASTGTTNGFSPAVIGGIVTLVAVAIGVTLFLAFYFMRISVRKKVVRTPNTTTRQKVRDNLNFS
jgi:hypothetical protein